MPTRSKIEYQQRITFIIELITRGVIQRRLILQNVINEYGVTESQVDKDLKVAREQIKEILEVDKPSKKAEIEMRYNDLYQKNIKAKDFRECRAVLDSLAKLSGLNEPDKLEIEEKINIPPKQWAKKKPKK